MKVLDHDGTDHLVDKIYDLINSGGSADYIVEEGTSGIWTYRKWASGIAECWGYQQYSNLSVTRQYGSVYLTAVGSPQAGPNFPFTISNPVVQRTVQGGNQWILSGGDPSTTNSGEFWICRPASATGVNVKVGIYVKGFWKEFTPSVSAKAQVGYEDFTSQVSVNATYYSMAFGSAKRVGNVGYLTYRLVVKTNFANAQTIPILTLPHNVGNDLINFLWFFRSGSGVARPVMESANNQIFEKYYGNAQSGDTVEFIFVYTISN